MPIKINFLANTREVVRDVANIGDALSDVSSSLDDVASDAARSGSRMTDAYTDAAKASERAAERVGDAYTDAGKDGERAAERLERSFKEASDATAKNGGKGPEDFARRTRESTDDANESVRTFKDEAKSNLSEVASSFDGSATSIVDLFQGTLGGVIADLGPAGLVAGTVAAAGVGLIGAAFTANGEQSEAFKQKVSDLTAELIESGREGSAGIQYIADKLQELATSTDDAEDNLKDLRSAADRSGGSYKDLAQAVAGNTDEIDKQIDKALKLQDAWQQTGQGQLEADDALGLSSSNRSDALDEYIQYLRDAKTASDDANDAQKNFADAGGPALQAAADAVSAYSEGVQSAYADAGASIDDYVKDGVFNLDRYQAATQKNLEAIVGYQKNMSEAQGVLAKSGHDTALQYLEQLGPDAAPLIDAFVKAPKAKQDELAAIWDALGAAGASSFGNRLQGDLDATTARKVVSVVPDMAAFNTAMAEATRQRQVHIQAYTDAPRGVTPMGSP